MALRFGRPDVATLTLPSGDTLTVKRRLNAGEERARLVRMSHTVDGELRVNSLQVGLATITAYLLDWTVTDAETGARVEIRGLPPADLEAVLDNLDPADFGLVYDAIAAHVEAMAAERDEEKKDPGWRDRIVSDLNVARRCGWRYEWVGELDADVYSVLVEELVREQQK